MKRLISAADVCKAKDLNQDIYLDKDSLITPQARDLAKEHGVKIIYGQENQDLSCQKKSEVKACCLKKDEEQTCSCQEPVLSGNDIYKLLKYALDRGILKEADLKNLL